MHIGLWWGNLTERDHLEDQGLDLMLISTWIFRKGPGGMDWIDLAEDRDRWQRALVNVVMKFRVT